MSKYGWPFLLFIGVPFFARVFGSMMAGLYQTETVIDSNTSYVVVGGGLQAGLWHLTSVLLLGLLYLGVRNTERDTLRLVWGCTLALSIVLAVFHFGAYFLDFLDYHFALIGLYAFLVLPRLAVLLWFARRASRLSLAHAFFLAFVAGGITLPYLWDVLPYAEVLLDLTGGILAVWLLANFDERTPRFRRMSAIAVVALEGLIYLPLLFVGVWAVLLLAILFFSFVLPLTLVYLVRVRQPQGGGRRTIDATP